MFVYRKETSMPQINYSDTGDYSMNNDSDDDDGDMMASPLEQSKRKYL